MEKFIFIFVLIVVFCLPSCKTQKVVFYANETSVGEEMNKSIIDGFFNGNDSELPKDVYLLK
ncbi:MAG: hypothetical protein WC466_10010 [Candidatus Izemoplasmatales bacterium]